jgi:predicted site-specific integrase-resolvase
MTSKEVLETLRISRGTLTKYVKIGLIRTEERPFGRYNYNKEDVYKIINKSDRKTFVYARVSTPAQKSQLDNQIEMIKSYCFSKGIKIDGVYSDVASGISYDKRKSFFEMLDLILENKVEKIIITYKDRLSRIGFNLFVNLFKKFGCEIEVISEVGSKKLDSEEIFEEIVSLLHCYSMKMYNSSKKPVIKDLIKE